MDRSNITVTMPIYEYEQLESKASGFGIEELKRIFLRIKIAL